MSPSQYIKQSTYQCIQGKYSDHPTLKDAWSHPAEKRGPITAQYISGANYVDVPLHPAGLIHS